MKKSIRKNDENKPPNDFRQLSIQKTVLKKTILVNLINFKSKNQKRDRSISLEQIKSKKTTILHPEKSISPSCNPCLKISVSVKGTSQNQHNHSPHKQKNKLQKIIFSDELISPTPSPTKSKKPNKNVFPSNDLVEISLQCEINGYFLFQEIGKGSYATVFKAEYVATKTQVAIKIYKKNELTETRENSIKHEISILLKLNHPNIVKFIDCFSNKTHVFLVTELILGKNLYTSFKKKFADVGVESDNKLNRKKFADGIMKQLFSAVFYLHSKLINHRDIKLDNVVYDSNSKAVKLIDFGFSKVINPQIPEKLFCGTPTYMSPEAVLHQESITLQSDVWALGVVYYAIIFNQFPFSGKTDRDLYLNIAGQSLMVPNWLSNQQTQFFGNILNKNWKERISIFQIVKNFEKNIDN